jgi:hypothetical protein
MIEFIQAGVHGKTVQTFLQQTKVLTSPVVNLKVACEDRSDIDVFRSFPLILLLQAEN